MMPLLKEIEMLRAFAERHGWKTADGAYVAGEDRVFYCTSVQSPTTPKDMRLAFEPWEQDYRADSVAPNQYPVMFSTKEAAESNARREWEK